MDNQIDSKKLQHKNNIDDLKAVLSTPAGKRLLNRVFRNAYMFVHSFHENPTECQMRSRITVQYQPLFNDCLEASKQDTIDLILLRKEE
jgi:hypothetical protein